MTAPVSIIESDAKQVCETFLQRVLPTVGAYIVGELTADKKFKNYHANSVRNAVSKVFEIDAAGNDAFFALASYHEPGTRKGDNVLSVKSFWIDLDCGEEKEAEGKGYAGKRSAVTGLLAFCTAYDLPIPTIVDSGGGLHCYWILNQEISAAEWLPLAKKLKQIMAMGAAVLLADPSRTADIASVLRPPGTRNRKPKYNSAIVKVLRESANIDFADFSVKVSATHAKLPLIPQKNGDLGSGLEKLSPPETPENIVQLKDRLKGVNAGCPYVTWRNIGWALASLNWKCGLELFDGWSKTALDRYDAAAVTTVWESYRPDGGIGIGTLIFYIGDVVWEDNNETAIERVTGRGGDVTNGKIFARQNQGRVVFIYETGDLLLYEPERGYFGAPPGEADRRAKAVLGSLRDHAAEKYKTDPDSPHTRRLFAHIERSSRAPQIRAMVDMAKSEPGMTRRIIEFDRDPMLLGVINGVLDLRTRQLLSQSPDLLVLKRCGVAFNSGATALLWEKFLREVQPDSEAREFLQRFAGYLLTGSVEEQKFGFFYGLGMNGKSVVVEIFAHILGEYALKIPTEMLMRHQRSPQGPSPDIVALKGVRFAYANETEEGCKLAESKVKEMTGGDTLTGRVPYGTAAISFQPTHKLIMVGNHKPEISDVSYGMWRRVLLILFGVTIPPAQRDGQLLSKLKAEGHGILNWMLEGLRMWQKDGLKVPKKIEAATAAYQDEQDTLKEWLSEHCEVETGATVKKEDAYQAYRYWAQRNGHAPFAQTRLTRRLGERGYSLQKDRRAIVGIKLNREGRAAVAMSL